MTLLTSSPFKKFKKNKIIMTRTDAIQKAHGLSLEDTVRVLLYQHQGTQWIEGLEHKKLQESMDRFTELIVKAPRDKVKTFIDYINKNYIAKDGEEVTKASFEERWRRGQKILARNKP